MYGADDCCSCEPEIEILQSPSDHKKYRFIVLSNGLRALLISDQMVGNVKPSGAATDKEDSGTEIEEEEGDEAASDKKSAAGLCVGVGSFSNPDDLAGLAHFLEHMVFIGSKKYPEENGFDGFLKQYGGDSNASTDSERTVFQFDVQRKYFKEALDRWAHFFISPLLKPDAIDREVEAVDSEFQLSWPSDSSRKQMLFASLAKPGHPLAKFPWGNAQTLKHDPKEKNINTYERVRDFWKTYYSADYMTLAVQSIDTLDNLEKCVREIFSEIPNNGLPQPNFGDLIEPFNTPGFNKLYRVVPVSQIHDLTIAWALPPQAPFYRVKPIKYLSWLIGYEGNGSILSLLRKKCWAVDIFGGNNGGGFDQNSTYSIFSVSVTLTDEGYKHFYEVAHIVFQYLKMLQQMGPQQRIYEEIQKIAANDFQYEEQTNPVENVTKLCETMQQYSTEDILAGHKILFEYKPEIIADALNWLIPHAANFALLSPENEGKCNLKEKWFGTPYAIEEIDATWKCLWESDFALNPDLHHPEANDYIENVKGIKACTMGPSDVQAQYILSYKYFQH